MRECNESEKQHFNILLARMSTLGFFVSKGAKLGVDEKGEYVLFDITNSAEALREPKVENIMFDTKKRIEYLRLIEGERVTLQCKPCSQRINGNDYAGGTITGVYRSYGYYSRSKPVIELELVDGQLGILLEDVIDRI